MNLKLLIKKIIVASMAFIGLFTLCFALCETDGYSENGFSFFLFKSQFIQGRDFTWAIYLIGAFCILFLLLYLTLAAGAGVNFIFKKKDFLSLPVMISSLACSTLYAMIGIIVVIVCEIMGTKGVTTAAYVPLILQGMCFAGYIVVGKLVPDTLGANKEKKEVASKQVGGVDYDALEKLAKLKNEGVITEEEFIAKKKEILGL